MFWKILSLIIYKSFLKVLKIYESFLESKNISQIYIKFKDLHLMHRESF